MRKRFIAGAMLAVFCSSPAWASEPAVSSAPAYVVLDNLSGMTLLEKDQHQQKNPGSLVQLMSLYTACELMSELGLSGEENVKIFQADIQHASSHTNMGLQPNTEVPLNVLLHAMTIIQAQDATLAVASFLGKTQAGFVEHMNRTAQEIGMKNSTFTSPVEHSNQQSSVADLALLVRHLHLKYANIAQWLSKTEMTHNGKTFKAPLSDSLRHVRGRFVSNDLTDSVIIWNTPEGQHVKRDGLTAVVLSDSTTSYSSAVNLLRSAVVDFDAIELYKAHTPIITLPLLNGVQDTIRVGSAVPVQISLHKDLWNMRLKERLSARFEYRTPLTAPLKKDQVIGSLFVELDKHVLATFELIALEDIEIGDTSRRFHDAVHTLLDQPKK